MECLPFRKRSPLVSPQFFVLLILQISFSKNGFRHPPDPIKNKNGSSLLTETKQSVRDTRRGFGPFPAKVGCIYRDPRPTVYLNFASRETIGRREDHAVMSPYLSCRKSALAFLIHGLSRFFWNATPCASSARKSANSFLAASFSPRSA